MFPFSVCCSDICCLVFPWYLAGWRQPWMLLNASSFCSAVPVCWDRAANFLSLVPCPKSNQMTLYTRSSLCRILSLPFRWKVGLCCSSLPLLHLRRMVCEVRLGNQVSSLEVKHGPSPGIAWVKGWAVGAGTCGVQACPQLRTVIWQRKGIGSRRELII